MKAETRKFIKPSHIITALGIGFCSIYDIWDAEGAVYLMGSYGAVPEALLGYGASDFYSDSDSSGGDSHHTGRSFLSGRRASVRAAVGICLLAWEFVSDRPGVFQISRRLWEKVVEKAADGQKYGNI